jgi:hypothetical protein
MVMLTGVPDLYTPAPGLLQLGNQRGAAMTSSGRKEGRQETPPHDQRGAAMASSEASEV